MKDLIFIGGEFLDFVLPKDKLYLFRYFRTDIERAFLRYFYCFGDFDMFSAHTGYACERAWLLKLRQRHEALLEMHASAKADFDSELLAFIESGKCKRHLLR